MLKFLRKKKNIKRIIWATALVIVPAFVLWGAGSAVRSKGGPTCAGTIFGRAVSFEEYSKSWRACKNQAISIYGDQFNKVAKYLDLDQNAWDRLILLTEAKQRKIKITDQAVIDQIKSFPFFQRDGAFDQSFYTRLLEYVFRTSPRTFEEEVRETLLIAKLYDLVTSEVELPEAAIREAYKKENERVSVVYLLVEPKEFEDSVKIEEEDLENHYRNHSQEFKLPEQANVEYLAIEYGDMESRLSITEEQIEEYYTAHPEEFEAPQPPPPENETSPPPSLLKPLTEVKDAIREKLISTESKKAARELTEKVTDSLYGEADFEKVGNEYRLPVKTTGFFSIEEPIPHIGWSHQFSQIAFTLAPGQMSDAIETPKGYYIIKVKEKRKPHIPPFEEAKENVRLSLMKEKADELAKTKAQEYLEKIKEKMKEPNASFESITRELHLETERTPLFVSRDYLPRIGESERLWEVARHLKEGEISDLVTAPRGYCILKVEEIKPINEEKFEEEKEAFVAGLLNKKRAEFYQTWFEKLKERADLKSNFEQRENR